jgi:cell division protein FtsB
MAKNRKNQAASIRFGPVLKVVLLCSLICGSAIGYVWQKGEIGLLGRQIVEREKRLQRLQNDNQALSDQISSLHSAVSLDRRTKELQLGLSAATPMQVVRLVETPSMPEKTNSRLFARRLETELTP